MALYHSAKGSVGYTIDGSTTVINGIASGFSENDFLKLNSSFDISVINKVEVFAKVTTGATVSMSNIIGHKWDSRFGIYLQGNKPSAMYYYYNGTSNTVSQNVSSVSLDANATYYLKATFDLTNHSSAIAVSTDKENWTENTKVLTDFVSFPSYQITYQIGYSSSGAFQGDIDLNETYIKLDGQAWFGVCPIEVKKHQLRGPVIYDEIGSPIITDGIASGFNIGDCLVTSNSFDPSTKSRIEVFAKITTGNTVSLSGIIGYIYNGRFGIFINGSGRPTAMFYYNDGSNNKVLQNNSDIVLSANTTYYLKAIYDLTSQTSIIGVSSNGVTWTENSKTISDFVSWPSFNLSYRIGMFSDGAFTGSIDLNETYIRVNGKLWFWQPRETEKIVVNGVEVWSKPQPTPVQKTAITSSSGNYWYTKNTPPLSTANTWEIKTRIKYIQNTSSNDAQWIIGNNNGLYTGPQLFVRTDGTFGAYASSGGLDFDIVKSETWSSQLTLSDGYIYDVSIGYDSSEGYYITCQDVNGGTLQKETITSGTANIYCTSSTFFLGNPAGGSMYFRGGQFLEDTTITINGSTWFDGSTAEIDEDYFNSGCIFNTNSTNNWYAYGNPTITDGIAIGFNNTNYIRYFGNMGNTYETNLFVKTPNSFSDCYLLGNINLSPSLQFTVSGGLTKLYAASTLDSYTGVTSFQTNTDYIIKTVFDGANTKVYSIVNNGYTKNTLPALSNWTLELTTASGDWYRNLIIGGSGSGLDFAGAVDLNNSCVL